MVFLNYRRSDTGQTAGRLYDSLKRTFGEKSVFFDVDTIPPGTPFPEHISAHLQKETIVLVLIGSGWEHCLDEAGRNRLHNPFDFVRQEVEIASAKKATLIPILVNGAKLEQPDELPPTLRFLAERQAILLRSGKDFLRDVTELIQSLRAQGARLTGRAWLRENGSLLLLLLLAVLIPFGFFSQQSYVSPMAPRIGLKGQTKPPLPLLHNLAPDDRLRLEGADESTVVRLAGLCRDKRIVQLAKDHEDDAKALFRIIRELLK